MKFSINKDALEGVLSAATRFSSSRISGNQAILGCYIEATKKDVIITTTNLNDFYTTSIKATIEKEGKGVLDMKKLVEFLHFLPPGDINIEEVNKTYLVQAGKTKGLIQTFNLEEFPQPPEIKEEKTTIHPTT